LGFRSFKGVWSSATFTDYRLCDNDDDDDDDDKDDDDNSVTSVMLLSAKLQVSGRASSSQQCSVQAYSAGYFSDINIS